MHIQRDVFLREKKDKASLFTSGLFLSLALVAAGFWGCDVGRILIETCTLGEDASCPAGQVCEATPVSSAGQGICVPGERDGDRLLPGKCNPGCPEGQRCLPTEGECVPESCTDATHCPSDWTCRQGQCVPDSCTQNDECPPGWLCQQGQCAQGGGMVVEANTDLYGAVMPLAWTNGHLVIGTSQAGVGDRISFFNPSNGAISSSAPLGSLTGLATLGDSGRVAFTSTHRISTLDSSGQFVSPNRGTDCLSGQAPLSAKASFPYGPTVISMGNNDGGGNWRFAVPVLDNTGYREDENRLLAYFPPGTTGSSAGHCWQTEGFPWGAVTPLVMLPDSALIFVRRIADFDYWISRRSWNNNTSTWSGWDTRPFLINSSGVISIAADSQSFWATIQAGSATTLIRSPNVGGEMGFLTSVHSVSPVALDVSGNAYVVVMSAFPDMDYEIRLYPAGLRTGYMAPLHTATLGQKTHAPVGSPILGQPRPGSPAEVYVVTTGGTVHAFLADTLTPLWTRTLLNRTGQQPMSIAPTAQPVLKGDRLWVMGTQGELRSVLVNSDGLSQSAQWPRMHRDNCNSNSHFVAGNCL